MKKFIFWLVILAIMEIGLSLFLTFWREAWWNAIALKQGGAIVSQLEIFTGVALVICFVAGFSGYLVSLTAIKWREKLTYKALHIHNSREMAANFGDVPPIENFNQRIQEDCMSYPDLVINLCYGTIKAMLYIIVFCSSLLNSFNFLYLLFLLGYTIVGTWLTKRIATPLVGLNYQQQRVEATYRNNLCVGNFTDCVLLMLGLAKKQKNLSYFQQFYGQVGVILPLLLIAPLYLTSGMTIGTLMRFNSLSSTILDNMSYGINNFAAINRLLSCHKRLREAKII